MLIQKSFWFSALILSLLSSCTNSPIKTLSCYAANQVHSGNPIETWTVDSETGELFEYSPFYEKLVSIEGTRSLDGLPGGSKTVESFIVNNSLKIKKTLVYAQMLSEKMYKVDLETMKYVELKMDPLVRVTGSCSWSKPETTAIHQPAEG